MKQLSKIFIGLIAVMLFVACNNTAQQIQMKADEFNKLTPIEYGGGLVLVKCEFDNVNFIYQYQLPEVMITQEEITELKSSMFTDETLADVELQSMFDLLIDGGYGLVYNYSDPKGNSVDITFTAQELQQLLNKE